MTNRKDNSSEDKSNYKVVKIGDIAYNTMRMWQGVSGVSRYEGIVSPAYTVTYLNNGDAAFFGSLFKQSRVIFDFCRYSQGLVSDTWNLKFKHFSEIKVTVPKSILEQQKISEFLTSLDEKISVIGNELNRAKAFKKGLLQQMFV